MTTLGCNRDIRQLLAPKGEEDLGWLPNRGDSHPFVKTTPKSAPHRVPPTKPYVLAEEVRGGFALKRRRQWDNKQSPHLTRSSTSSRCCCCCFLRPPKAVKMFEEQRRQLSQYDESITQDALRNRS
jgi:hypothetical protein